jgi:hypothetical protein
VFYPSTYTPDQGGYFAEQDGDPMKAKAIANFRSSLRPYQRVNPSLRAGQQAQRRQRTAENARTTSSLLGGNRRLLAVGDQAQRKTLLGG